MRIAGPEQGGYASAEAAIIAGIMLLVMVVLVVVIRRAERRRTADMLEKAAQQVRSMPETAIRENPLPPDAHVGSAEEDEGVKTLVSAAREAFSRLRGQYAHIEGETARNRLLASEISKFYSHVRVLNGQDFSIDFFEYHAGNGTFVFLTGLATLFGSGSQIFREMQDTEFFTRFACNLTEESGTAALSLEEEASRVRSRFGMAAEESLKTGLPFSMEFRAASQENGYLWLRCWGRPDIKSGKIDGALLDISREVGRREADRSRFLYDNITGFFNRNALSEVGGQALAAQEPGEVIAFIYFGLRRYGEFEARFGMVAGNGYIRAFADMLRENMTERTTLFRWWGPNFLCIVHGFTSVEAFRGRVEQVFADISTQTRNVNSIPTEFPVSAGYAVAGLHGTTPAELLEHAAFAKQEADKCESSIAIAFDQVRFDASRQVVLRRSFIRDVINRNELYVVYQPIVSLKTAQVYGFEALSRPSNGIYRSITELIEDAEDTGNYATLEKRMVYNALDGYMDRPHAFRDAWLFINTAPVPALAESDYMDIRDRYFSHMHVVYEVIERSHIDPDEMARRKTLVRGTGAKFALDDFGSGYSNHLALLALEPDIIKIDRGLVQGVDQDIRKQQMLEDIIGYARLGGTRVLAEGVETQGQLETLCRMGVDYAQGYYLGRPAVSFCEVLPEAENTILNLSGSRKPGPVQAGRLLLHTLALRDPALADRATRTGVCAHRLAMAWGMDPVGAALFSLTGLFVWVGALVDDEMDWKKSDGSHAAFRTQVASSLIGAFLQDWPFRHVFRRRSDRSEPAEEARLLSLAERLAVVGLESAPPVRAQRYADVLRTMAWPEGMRLETMLPELAADMDGNLHDTFCQRLAPLAQDGALAEWMPKGSLLTESQLTEGMLRIIAGVVDCRSPYHCGHAAQMEKTAELLCRMLKLGWQFSERVRLAALCGGLGNVSVPAHLFDRKNPLTSGELALIRARANRSRQLLTAADLVALAELQPRQPEADVPEADGPGTEGPGTDVHPDKGGHARATPPEGPGKGFARSPDRPAEKDVAQGRAILAVADILAALLQERAWRRPLSLRQAGAVLADMSGAGLLDALVADTAIENLQVLEEGMQAIRRATQEQMRMASIRLHVVSGGMADERNPS